MDNKLKNLLFILILGSVSAALLLGIRAYTLPIIERYQEVNLKSTVLEAAGIGHAESDLDEVFNRNIRVERKDELTYYLTPDNLYIFEFEGRGLWGMIKGLVTLKPDLETIQNIRIIAQEETPGLGGRIAEEEFLNQFQQKRMAPELALAMRQKAVRDNEVDAISGASLTSKALIKMINQSGRRFRRRLRKGR
jgi:Na+-transporting NADH:ubiquinone oxidoreductase subunit C